MAPGTTQYVVIKYKKVGDLMEPVLVMITAILAEALVAKAATYESIILECFEYTGEEPG